MSDQLPTGDVAVYNFLEMIALAFVFGAVDTLVANRPWFIWAGCFALAFLFFLAGIKWPHIKNKIGIPFSTRLERVANDSRYRAGLALLLIGCVGIYGILYVHSLRRDLDTYAMPRTVTPKQSEILREHLSPEPHAVTIQYNQRDSETAFFAQQLWTAFLGAGWNVTYSGFDTSAAAGTLNDGICIDSAGDTNLPDPKHDPRVILQEAFRAARIDAPCGGSGGIGSYRLLILVGHRPVRMGDQQTTLTKIGRWITKLGRSQGG